MDAQARFAEIDRLLVAVDRIAAPEARAAVQELVQTLLALHSEAMERTLEIVHESDLHGQALIDDLSADPLVGELMLLHGLHPLDLATRLELALDGVRPYMHSHGGDVELLAVTPEGGARLRLTGSCHGCPSSRVTLKYAVEEAVYAAAPDLIALEVEGVADAPPAPAGFVPLAAIVAEAPAADHEAWVSVDAAGA